MAREKDRSVSSEVTSRLEELFTEDDGPDNDIIFEEYEKPVNDVLRALKSVILSVEWEINDETMSSLMDQIDVLKKVYQQDRILLLFLQLLGKIGIYIKAKKADAHPNSIKMLSSVYQSFEKAVLDHKLSESDRKKLLQIEVGRFLELKEKIALKKNMQIANKIHEKGYPRAPQTEKLQMSPELANAIKEIKSIIRAEFNDMKAELKMWMKNRS
jgi:hypothetical protein